MTLLEHYQFGPFHVDPNERECRRGNEAIALTHKAFDLLLLLLRNAGRTIPKAELMTVLWPDVAVEENNLTQTVSLLRKALGDDSERAIYIQTVPRVGYKFVAAVAILDPPAAPRPAPGPGIQWKRPVALAAASVATFVAGLFLWQRMQPKPLTNQDVLVLADFVNSTGDAVFDGALRQALAFELEKSAFLKIMDDAEVNQTLQLMGRPQGQRITNDIAHEVCVRDGQKATISGSIASLGKIFQIGLQATNCQTGATLAREQAEAEDKEHVVKAVAKAATGMRTKLGESLSSIEKLDRPSASEVTTTSLEALKAYQLGYDLLNRLSPEAIPQFQRAILIDPNFAHAYEMLGVAYGNSGDPARQRESLTKAFALIDRVSEREGLYISGQYYRIVTREMNKAFEAYRIGARTYPRFAPPHNGLSFVHASRGEYEKALEEGQEALRLEPRNSVFIGNVMAAYMNLDRFAEAKAVAERAFSQRLDGPPLHNLLLRISYIQDDHSAQEKEIGWWAGKPEEYQILPISALYALAHGQRRKANEIQLRATEMARRQGLTNFQSGLPAALSDALMGDCKAARKEKSNPALVFCGDARAVKLAEEQVARNPPLNPDTTSLLYQRGLAELRAGKGAEAAAEFQKLLDHKGRNWGPLYSPAYLGLARSSALLGDTAKARRAYQDFLALWKDADKDLPLLSQAKQELAALR